MAEIPSVCIVSLNAWGALNGGRGGSIGGIQHQTSLIARFLATHGWKVETVVWNEGHGNVAIDGVGVREVCRAEDGLPGLRFFYPRWTSLLRALRSADADVYYQNGSDALTGQVALWCKMRKRRFVFATASDADCDPELGELKLWRVRTLYRLGLRLSEKILTQTEMQREKLRVRFFVDSTVLPMPCPGPSDTEYHLPSLCEPPRVLWVGRICAVKRPDRLLTLARSCPDILFDVVGPSHENDVSAKFYQQAATLPNVVVKGASDRAQMPGHYQRATILCCTSDYEGFPNTFLEAWSNGVPVVSTFDPDNLIKRRRLGLVVKNETEMAKSLKSLLSSPEHWRELSTNCRRYYMENHAMEKVLPKLMAILRGQKCACPQEA